MTYPIVNSVFTNENAMHWLSLIINLNGRLLLLLALCCLVLNYFHGSAARKHLIITLAFIAALLLPLIMAWSQPFEIVFEIIRPINEMDDANASSQIAPIPPTTLSLEQSSMAHWQWYCLLIYLSTCLFLLLRILHSNMVVLNLVNGAHKHSLEKWECALRQGKTVLGLGNNIQIRHSPRISSPMTWGYLKPVILIPTSALHWSESMQRSTLLHELGHIKRNDCLSKQVARILCAIYWINPLSWMLLKRFGHYAETASDDIALASGIQMSYYAENLVAAAKQVRRPFQCGAALALIEHRASPLYSHLSQRIVNILNPVNCRAPVTFQYSLAMLVLIVGFILPLSSLKPSIVQEEVYVLPRDYNLIPLDKLQREITTKGSMQDIASATLASDYFRRSINLAEQLEALPPPRRELISVDETSDEIKSVAQESLSLANTNNSSQSTTTIQQDQKESTPQPIFNSIALSDIAAVDISALAPTHNTLDHIHPFKDVKPNIIEKLTIEPFTPTHVETPDYPRRAETRGIQGELVVQFNIDTLGKVTEPKVIQAQPNGVFDRAVLKALEKNRYEPQKVNGRPVTVSGVQERYVFKLET